MITFFKITLWIDTVSTYCEIGLRWVPENHTDDKIGSGNGSPLGNMPLSEMMFAQICVTM